MNRGAAGCHGGGDPRSPEGGSRRHRHRDPAHPVDQTPYQGRQEHGPDVHADDEADLTQAVVVVPHVHQRHGHDLDHRDLGEHHDRLRRR
jgi:hypothetical protein